MKTGVGVCALVPMRHNSERVRGKNYRPLDGKPLFTHVVEALLQTPEICEVRINTDSPIVSEICASDYPSVVVVERPPYLTDGRIPMTEIIKYEVERSEHQWYVQTHSTNPFLRPSSISAAITALQDSDGRYDSLFTVTRLQARLYGPDGQAINHDPNVLLRTQDLPPVYLENSCLYAFPRSVALQGRRLGDRPMMHELGALEAHDIDTEEDWRMAEYLASLEHA
jgi:CMP-N-acetylneuraminic acid synthetase